MRVGVRSLMIVVAMGGVAAADHTKEDARATTAKLEAILHPRKAKRPATKATTVTAAKAKPQAPEAAAEAATPAKRQSALVVDPLYSLIVHAWSIPFDPKEREAHLRDIPKNAKELDAHLRRLDAALHAH